jgi:hypothetical protein
LLWLGTGDLPVDGRWVVALGYLSKGELVCNDPVQPLPVYGQLRLLKPSEEQTWLKLGAVGLALGLGDPQPGMEAYGPGPEGNAPPVEATNVPEGQAVDGRSSFDTTETATSERQAAPPDASPYWWRLIETYASWFGLDPYYVAAVVLAESGGNPNAVGDQGHSIGLMQLHDAGFGSGLYDARFDPALNLWHGTKALAAGMARFSDPYETYARYYNPGGQVAGERVMAWYGWLREVGEKAQR